MRIVTCITRLIRGGAQRIALETAVRLAERGHEAPIWCGPETGPEGSLHEEAAERGVTVRIVKHLRRAVQPWHDGRALDELTRALRRERPDLLHTHSSKAGILGREAARRAGVARVVHTVHGWGFTPQTSPWLAAAFSALERRYARAGPMVFVNPADREEGRRRGIVPHTGSRVIAPGIDLTPYRDGEALRAAGLARRREAGIPQDAVVGGFLGRLSAQKGPEILLEVAGLTSNSDNKIHWLVVGDGPMAQRLRRQAHATPQLAGRMRWVGLQPTAHSWLAAMDFLLLPSRWEGAPLTLMEAMAAGVPVIASDLAGVRWVLDGCGDRSSAGRPTRGPSLGVLVAGGDVRLFRAAVENLARDRSLRSQMGASARAVALRRFGLEAMVESLLSLYTSDR